jgi:chemotaxis protein CheD
MSSEIITVGIGEYKIAESPSVLRTILGSCVGVAMYDKINKVGGLAHVYLPSSKEYSERLDSERFKFKFADILLPAMIKDMEKQNAKKRFLIAYIVGGASLFQKDPSNMLNIGEKNLLIAKDILKSEKIAWIELAVGGSTGRKVHFNLANGDIEIIDLNNRNGSERNRKA